MPLIRIVSTGGTIANTSGGLIDINDVLKAIPQAAEVAELEVAEATRVRSASMRLPQWLDIARTVKEAADAPQVDIAAAADGYRSIATTAICAATAWSRKRRASFSCSA